MSAGIVSSVAKIMSCTVTSGMPAFEHDATTAYASSGHSRCLCRMRIVPYLT